MYPRKLILTPDHIGKTVIMNNGDRAKVLHQDPDGGFWLNTTNIDCLKFYVNRFGKPYSMIHSSIIDERDYPRPETPLEENLEKED